MRRKWRSNKELNQAGFFGFEGEGKSLEQLLAERNSQRWRCVSDSTAIRRRQQIDVDAKLAPEDLIGKRRDNADVKRKNNADNSAKFFCKLCPDFFDYPLGLNNHLKKHGFIGKYNCQFCNYGCNDPTAYQKHRDRHANTPLFRTIDFDGGSPEPDQQRRSSVDMRRESFAEILDNPEVALKDLGKTGTPARIVEVPEHVTVVEDELVTLECVVEGNQAPTFAWKKGGREVPLTDDRVRCQTDGDTANAGAASAASTSTATALTTRFRVLAVNEAGPSAPPAPSASQICTARFLKPQIITAQRKWKVRAGNTLTLGIKFVGTPDPSVCWVKAGGTGTLPPELIMEEHRPGNTSIFFPAAKRSECGTYELRLKNKVGETEGHFEVLVQDRPAPPKGPLAVDNVTRDSCTLSWQPPEDDGGSEVISYVVGRRDVGSQVWVPVDNIVVGTSSTVPNLQEGHDYQFRVCAVNAFGCSDPLNTDSAVLAKDPYGSFDESDAEDPAEEVPPGTVEIGLRSLDTPKGQRTRSGTAPGKSRRLAPVNNAASADQSADKAHAQNTPKAQRTRSGTVQRKSRRLAPVECAPSAAQNADKPPAQNTSVGRRTTRSAGTGAAPLTPPRQRMVNLDESSNQEDEVFVEAHPMQPVTADGTPTLPGGIPRNSQGPIDVVQKSTPTRGKKNTVNAEGEADKAIVAKNKAGPGQPTDPSDMIMLPSTSDAPRRSRRIAASTAVSALHQIADKEPAAETLSNLAKLLELCGQREAWSWEELEQHNGCDFSEWKKIAEGSYADVYKFGDTVFKVIRLAATPEEPDEPMVVSAKQVFNELFITSELGKSIPTFIKLVMAKVVCGKFPGPLLEQFNKFKYLNESAQNLPPLDNDAAKFALMGMVASGDTLESYLKKEKTKNEQRCSIFLQIAFALAVAEKKYDFEHRDLHTGNVLVEHCRDNENIRFLYGNQQFDVASKGVRVTIIDFSLSHFRIDGHLFFDDLSKDPDLFTGNGVSCENGDYQFNIYRMMQEKVGQNWARFWPQTNCFWMSYLAVKLFDNTVKEKKEKKAIKKLFNFHYYFKKIEHFILDPDFKNLFASK